MTDDRDRRPILATGFVADSPEEGTTFPSAGGNSGDPRVQAIYWRCLVVLFASARLTNPDQRLVLFSNVAPPLVDGIAIAAVLDRYGVEQRRVPLSARLARARTPAWGNVLYFFDILAALAHSEAPGTRMALVDSDVVVTGSLAPLFALLDRHDYAGYAVDSRIDEDINGMTRADFAHVIAACGGQPDPPAPKHFGGELFATAIGTWLRDRGVFSRLLDDALRREGPGADVRTEEHIFSIAWPLLGGCVADANALMSGSGPARGITRRRWGTRPCHYGTCRPKSAMGWPTCSGNFPAEDFPSSLILRNFGPLLADTAAFPERTQERY